MRLKAQPLRFMSLSFFIQSFYSHKIVISAIKTKLTWVNGIGHNTEHMENGKKKILDLFGVDLDYCHNPTAMTTEDDHLGFLNDLTQAGTQKLGRITGEVDELVKHLKEALEFVGKSGRVVHIAHSQGAIITALAAKKLSFAELGQIEVIAFGGAAALRRSEFPFYRVVNYYAVNDPLLHVVPAAVKALRSGFLSTMSSTHEQTDPEFVFLSPRSGDPVEDHMLFGPTYGPVLAWEGQRYQQTYVNLVSRTFKMTTVTAISSCKLTMEKMDKILRYLFQVTIFRLCMYCMYFYSWQREKVLYLQHLWREQIVKPVLELLYTILSIVKEFIRMKTEGKEKYEPLEPMP